MPNTQFTDNLNIISESNLEIELLDGDLSIIQKLDDEPNDVGGLSAQQLKAKFDESGLTIQRYINEKLIPAVLAENAVEVQRAANEAQRQENEAQRIENENARQTAESGRAANEQTRTATENTRIANESARVAAEAQRAAAETERRAAEAIRLSNEEQRQNVETGYIAQAQAAAARAEKAAQEAEGIAGGDFATKVQAQQYATNAETNANRYTDQKIAAIPTPDVSGQIGTHNADTTAHPDIRQLVANASSVKVYTGAIGTTWTENEDTGVKSQNVAIAGVLAKHTAKVDHLYTGDGTADGYAQFVEEENQYLTYITNGYAETYDGGVTFYIFGDAPTVAIPIVVEVA